MQPECRDFANKRIWRPEVLVPAAVGLLALLPIAILSGGCRPSKPSGAPTKPHAGTTVRIAVPENAILKSMLERQGGAWSDRSGAKIELIQANSSDADVYFYAPAEMPRLVEEKKLQQIPLGSLNSGAFEFGSILRPLRLRLSDWQGSTYGLPMIGGAFILVFRSDLLSDPKHLAAINKRLKSPFKPDGVWTWQQVAVIAEHFSSTSPWSDGSIEQLPRPALPPLPSNPADFDFEFHSVAAPFRRMAVSQERVDKLTEEERFWDLYDYQLDGRTGDIRIADPGFVAALRYLQQIQKYRGSFAEKMRPADAIRTGKAVVAIVPLADLAVLQASSSPVRNKIGVAGLPGSSILIRGKGEEQPVEGEGNFVPYLGAAGWFAGLGAKANNIPAALDLILNLAGRDMCLEIAFEPAWGSGPTRHIHYELANRSGWHAYGLGTQGTNQLLAALERGVNPSAINPAYRVRLPNSEKYMQVFAERLRPAIERSESPTAALQDVARQWLAIDPDANLRRSLYRRSIGLE